MLSIAAFELIETLTLPFFDSPDLVVIIIAPFAPRSPYNAAAPGPFKTVMVAISSGLISFKPLPKSTGESESS